jgi:hypothetical protein
MCRIRDPVSGKRIFPDPRDKKPPDPGSESEKLLGCGCIMPHLLLFTFYISFADSVPDPKF